MCLRERIQRENLFHRLVDYNLPLLANNQPSNGGANDRPASETYHFHSIFAIELIHISSKYYPPLLTQANNNQVLDVLRGVWIRMQTADQFLPTETRRLYSRI